MTVGLPKDGKGFNLTLEALPVSGRIVLRKPKERGRGVAATAFLPPLC